MLPASCIYCAAGKHAAVASIVNGSYIEVTGVVQLVGSIGTTSALDRIMVSILRYGTLRPKTEKCKQSGHLREELLQGVDTH